MPISQQQQINYLNLYLIAAMNYNFEEVKSFLEEKGLLGTQCFCTENLIGDPMEVIYDKDGVLIKLLKVEHNSCLTGYFEIFGLNNNDFDYLEDLFLEHVDENNIFGAIVKDMTISERALRNGSST